MASCRDSAQLASEAHDRSLNFQEHLSLRVHLLYCNACLRYHRQLKFLRLVCAHAFENYPGSRGALNDAARARIQARLNEGQ